MEKKKLSDAVENLEKLYLAIDEINEKIENKKTSIITDKKRQALFKVIDDLIMVFESDAGLTQEDFLEDSFSRRFTSITIGLADLYSRSSSLSNKKSREYAVQLIAKFDEYFFACYNFLYRQPVIKENIVFVEHVSVRIKNCEYRTKPNDIIRELWDKFDAVSQVNETVAKEISEYQNRLQILFDKIDALDAERANYMREYEKTKDLVRFSNKEEKYDVEMNFLQRVMKEQGKLHIDAVEKYKILWAFNFLVLDEIHFIERMFSRKQTGENCPELFKK